MDTRQPTNPPWILRRYDQQTVAVLVLLGLTALVVFWLAAGGFSGGLVEIERHEAQPAEFRVDLNAAGWAELAQLPGIGETLARRIVESRLRGGRFITHDDLRRVSGVGPKKLAAMKPYLLPIETPPMPVGATATSN